MVHLALRCVTMSQNLADVRTMTKPYLGVFAKEDFAIGEYHAYPMSQLSAISVDPKHTASVTSQRLLCKINESGAPKVSLSSEKPSCKSASQYWCIREEAGVSCQRGASQ